MPPTDPLSLDNGTLRVELLPRGGRLTSLRDLRLGREWLLSRQGPATGLDFAGAGPAGFDECLPNVAAGPDPGGGPSWPDHGELWNRPWAVTREGEALVGRITGQRHPYRLTRRLALEGATLCLDYTLDNPGPGAFTHLWSAHPLLRATPGMRVELPDGVDRVQLAWASDPALGAPGDLLAWPGGPLELARVPDRAAAIALKLFVPAPPRGHAGLWDPATGHALALDWDPAQIPHLGVWLCYGGWPTASGGHLAVALEPCTGMPDALDEAWRRGCARTLQAGGTARWTLRLSSGLRGEPGAWACGSPS
jgi:galactose mutarotase-like enzyme